MNGKSPRNPALFLIATGAVCSALTLVIGFLIICAFLAFLLVSITVVFKGSIEVVDPVLDDICRSIDDNKLS